MTMKSDNDAIVQSPRGKAFCTTWHAMHIDWDRRFEQSAFTLEVWAMPKLTKEWLVRHRAFPEANSQGQLGWGLAVGSQGELAAMIVGKQTRWVWNHSPILDGQWHHLAMTFNGTDLMLYVDGKPSKQDETLTDPVKLPDKPGILIGSPGTTVSEALVQEVRLSSGLRVPATADDPMAVDEQTLALWRLDNDGRMMDTTSRCPPGVITAFVRESLDEFERREYRAGPTPLDLPAQKVDLIPGGADHVEGAAVLSLDGQWQMTEGGDEASRLTERWPEIILADVPGSVHTALEKAGKIPDPKFGLNETIRERTVSRPGGCAKHFRVRREPGIGWCSMEWPSTARFGSMESSLVSTKACSAGRNLTWRAFCGTRTS